MVLSSKQDGKIKSGKLGYSINGNLSTVNNKVIESPERAKAA